MSICIIVVDARQLRLEDEMAGANVRVEEGNVPRLHCQHIRRIGACLHVALVPPLVRKRWDERL